MSSSAEVVFNTLLRRLGIEVRRANATTGGLARNSPFLDPFRAQAAIVGDAKVVVEVGAHEGKVAAKYLHEFPNAMVYCFEPFPASVAKLAATLAGSKRWEVIAKAVADRTGLQALHINEHTGMNSLLGGPGEYAKARSVSEIVVETTTLDAFLEDRNIERVDILKMDIEGSELMALQGAARALDRQAVDVLYVEVGFVRRWRDAPLFHDVARYLDGLGYGLFGLYRPHHALNGHLRRADAIFLSETVRARRATNPSENGPGGHARGAVASA